MTTKKKIESGIATQLAGAATAFMAENTKRMIPPIEVQPADARRPVLSDALKAKADAMIAARVKKMAKREADLPPMLDRPRRTSARKVKTEKSVKAPRAPAEALCTFAIRLTEDERDSIHAKAGPGKATQFARGLLVAAARGGAAGASIFLEAWRKS